MFKKFLSLTMFVTIALTLLSCGKADKVEFSHYSINEDKHLIVYLNDGTSKDFGQLIGCFEEHGKVEITEIIKIKNEGIVETYTVKLSNGESMEFNVTINTDNVKVINIIKSNEDDNYDYYKVILSNGDSQEVMIAKEKNNYEDQEGLTHLDNMSKDYSAEVAANHIMNEALVVNNDVMKGVHDAQFVIINDKAYIVYEANDVQAGEYAGWDYVYAALSIVDLKTHQVEKIVKIAKSEQVFANLTLPHGAAFVPRIAKLDENTLRIYFASEEPGVRNAITYYIDYDLKTETLSDNVYPLKYKNSLGEIVYFTTEEYYKDYILTGYTAYEADYGAYLLDIFYKGDTTYIALNNFAGAQVSLAKFNEEMNTVELISHIANSNSYNKFTEHGIIQKEDGSFMTIMREERRGNYFFTYSEDGINWTAPVEEVFVVSGTNSKPTLDNFNGYYLMGWNDTDRSVYRLQYSKDCKNWIDLYTFYSDTTFQYPSFEMYNNEIYYCATIGNKQQIIFGKLYIKEIDGHLYIDDSFTDLNALKFADKSEFIDLGYIQGNPNGSMWHAMIKRDDKGIYYTLSTNKINRNDKVFLALDVKGNGSYQYTKNNLFFRFKNGIFEVRSVGENNESKYRKLNEFMDVVVLRKQQGTTEEYNLFIPYSAIKEIAPLSDFLNETDDLYFTCSAAIDSHEYSMSYEGVSSYFGNPITYYRLTYDNKVIVRDDFNIITTNLSSSANGASWIVKVMRNEDGIYLDATSTKVNQGDKLFFMLDTLGVDTSVNNNHNLMFKFENTSSGWVASVQTRHTLNATTRGYVPLINHPEVLYTITNMSTYVKVMMFIPYETIHKIAPNVSFDSFEDNLYFTPYAANGGFVENVIYKSKLIKWDNPQTYLTLTKDNKVLIAR